MNNFKLSKFLEHIKKYFLTLLCAVLGINPYERELKKLSERHEKIAKQVDLLSQQYNSALDKWDDSMKANSKLMKQLEQKDEEIGKLQNLVENLRARIQEKDAAFQQQRAANRERMDHMKAEYQQRIDKYVELVRELKEEPVSSKAEKSDNPKPRRKKNGHRTSNKKAQTEA